MPVIEAILAAALMHLTIGPSADAPLACDAVSAEKVPAGSDRVPREPSGDEQGNRSIVVTGKGPIARCCPLGASEEECRAYLASDFGQEPGECEAWQKRAPDHRNKDDVQTKRDGWLDVETTR